MEMQYRSSGDLGGMLPPLPRRQDLIDFDADGESLNKLLRTFTSESTAEEGVVLVVCGPWYGWMAGGQPDTGRNEERLLKLSEMVGSYVSGKTFGGIIRLTVQEMW